MFWAPAWLRDWFEEGDPARGLDRPVAVLDPADHEPEERAEAFLEQIGINFGDGRIRLVFVADEIRASLPRLVEFLNGQMPRVEDLAVEIRRYRRFKSSPRTRAGRAA